MRNTNDLDPPRADDDSPTPREQLLNLRLEAERRRRKTTRTINARGLRDEPVPVSYAQERLWFLDQLGLVGAAYNMPLALRLSGELDEGALERSFAELVLRHESLRTRFATLNGVPHQLIDPPGPFTLHRRDLSEVANPQQHERQLREWMQREQLHRFDLSVGPLLRVVLLKLANHEHALLVTMHHIVSDGWSVGVLVRELSAVYASSVSGKPSPLPRLAIQYADYAIWQRQWLKGEVLQKQLKYWGEQLKGAPLQLQLPTDRPRPPVESCKGAMLRFHLPATLTVALEELARREGATLFMVSLAAYQLLLSRWSGQRDIVVGSPIAGRRNREVEGLIGFFVNTLALRTDVSESLTFGQLLQRVRGVTLGAYAHQDLPFEIVVTELRPERNLTRQPIVQVMLALQNYPEEQLELAGLTWRWSGLDYVTTHFDLTLYLYEVPDGLAGVVEYATDLFDPETIERMARHFRALLEGIVANPESPIYELSLLSDGEKQQLLVDWNATAAPYPQERCVHELFADQVERTPEAPALMLEECTLSYRELNAWANQLAHYLIGLGVGPDVVVGVFSERSVEMVVGFLGVLKAGGAYLPLDSTHPRERLTFMLNEAQVSIVVSTETLAARLPEVLKHVVCLNRDADMLQHPASNPSQDVHPNNLAYVLYTSGSTGRPKSVGVAHRNITRLLIGTDYIRVDPSDVFLQLASPVFDASTFEIWGALLHGAKLVLYPDREVDLDRLEQVLKEQRVSVLWLTAGLFHQVMDERPRALASLKWLLAGGDVLSSNHVRQALKQLPGCRLINGYGPTEATTFSVCYTITDPTLVESTVPIGHPIANTQVYVLDSRLQPVPVGLGGELYIGGDGLSRGYLNHPALTAERFVVNPFGRAGTRLYRTGDLVRWRPNGTLDFIGRTDNQVKIRGYRIEPAEIESVLLEHAAVKQAIVLMHEETSGERRLVCYVVGDRNAAVASSDKDAEKLRSEIVGEWETLYEETYGTQNQFTGPSFVGWNSSFTGEPIPEAQMQEWLASTIRRIKAVQPNRVLEIGCGVGLLLQHLAPQCLVYVGTDFSASALAQLRQWVTQREDLRHVELLHRSATEFHDLEVGSFDTVVLNSVVQYFPDIDYLMTVLQGAVRLLRADGKIFIGDVRHLGLLPMFHSAVQLSKAAATVSVGQLKKRIARAVAQDKELVIDPQLFRALPGNLPGISAAEVHLKRGQSANELTSYRYDVTLQVGEQLGARVVCEPLEWQTTVGSLGDFEAALKDRRWCATRFYAIPNQRVGRQSAGQRLVETSDERLEAGAIRRQLNECPLEGVNPEKIWEMAEAHGYDVTVSPGEHDCVEARLLDRARRDDVPRAVPPLEPVKPWSAYANDPMENGFRQQLIPRLRAYLKGRLPEYMMPSAWIMLKQLPLTANGKVDRRALPAPQGRPEEMGEYIAPQNALEQTLAEIWIQLLPVDQVGVQDNFFELGGHSLLIVQLMERLRRVGLSTDVRTVYENPTLEALARTLTGGSIEQFVVPPNLIPAECKAITPQMLPLVELESEQIKCIVQAVRGGAPNIQDIYPLAALQEGILFHHLLNERSGDPYVLPILLSLSSREVLENFILALQQVMDRHDVFRSAVLWEQLPQPVQVVYRRADLPLEEFVLNQDRDPIEQLKERMAPERQRLDLRQAPLMRLQIAVNPDGAQWYALLQLHHLICDHESIATMISEVTACFDGRAQDLPEPISYRNHVAQALAYARTNVAEVFFRSKLAQIDEPTAPFGLLDVYGDGSRIEEAYRSLEPALARRVRAQGRILGVSAATLFHAAWGLVISRTSGRDEVVFGTVLLGRLQGAAGAQRILGPFINTLPLRLQLHGVTTSQLVEQTQRELTELLAHEQASLAIAQRCSAVGGSAPLFSALLNYRHTVSNPNAEWAGMAGVQLLAGEGRTNYPITLSIDDLGEGFTLHAQTDRCIDPNRMTGYLHTAVQSLVEALEQAPQMPALRLAILQENERQQVIELFNAMRAAYPQYKPIHALFEEQVERTPEAVAVVYNGQSLTYTQLNDRGNQLARYLRSKGVGPDQLVGLCVERSLEMMVGLLGILKAGGAYVPLDPNSPAERLAYMLRDAAPRVLLLQERLKERLPITAAEVIALDKDWNGISEKITNKRNLTVPGLCPYHLAYVIYTSGSTGDPKGVMVEHRNVTRLFAATQQWFGFNERDVWALFHSIAFDFSVWELWGALLYGGRVVVVPYLTVRSPQEFFRLLCEEGVTVLNQTPSAFAQIIDAQARSGEMRHSLRVVIFGGEALELRVLRPWVKRNGAERPRLVNMYGITETTVHVTYRLLRAEEIESERESLIGTPISDLRTYLLDRHGQPVPIGVTGEIHVGGAGVARGYLNQPELTAERFLPDPFSGDPQALVYKTGDLGRWMVDGSIVYLGRNDRQVKIRGFRIELGEIEAQLVRHANVRNAVVIAREDAPGEKRLVAYLIPGDLSGAAEELSAEPLRAHLKANLPEYMVPSAFVILKRLPLTTNGKLDRRALPAPECAAYLSEHYEAPQGQAEETLAGVWQELLHVKRIGRHDNFFDLGGHSLLAIRAVSKINQIFGSALSVIDAYRSLTIRDLATLIRSGPAEDELVNLSQEAVLDEAIVAKPGPRRIPAETLMLTGCTGFVGRFLLTQLLQDTNATLYCIVRAGSRQQASVRLKTTLSKWDLWCDEFDRRIVAIPGDLTLPRLGLDEATYQTVCQETDSIYHCGTSMNHLESYAMAKAANVVGARELLKTATHLKPKLINYISTSSVFSGSITDTARVVDEESPIDHETHWASHGYAASKWVGEKLFMTASDRGIPCNIFRLGFVWADTKQGRYDELQREYRIFKSCLLSGYGIKNYRYGMAPTPVDYVVRAVVFLANSHSNGHGIFHISSSSSMAEGLFERCNEIAGTSLELVTFYDWICEIKRLHQQGRSLPAVPLIEFAFSMDEESFNNRQRTLESSTRFDCARTRRELEHMGIVAPVMDDGLLRMYVQGMVSRDADLRDQLAAKQTESTRRRHSKDLVDCRDERRSAT